MPDTTPDSTASIPPMNDEARQVLVHLMKQGVILQAEKPKLCAALCLYQQDIRRHLGEVFLYLTLDERTGVAFVAIENQQPEYTSFGDENEEDTRSLITRRTLTLYDTLVLLGLRKHFQERETAGEQKIMVDEERLLANLAPMLPESDRASLDKRKLSGSLKRFAERKLLTAARGEEGRYQITPLIRYVVNPDFLDRMIAEYKQLAQTAPEQPAAQPTEEPPPEPEP